MINKDILLYSDIIKGRCVCVCCFRVNDILFVILWV
jgi:hypothetical protein